MNTFDNAGLLIDWWSELPEDSQNDTRTAI